MHFVLLLFVSIQIAGLDLNESKGSGNLCTLDSSSGPARYVPPHLRSGGNNNFSESERPDYRGGRENRDFRDNRDFRNDNRG